MSVIEARFRGTIGDFSLDAAFTCPGRGVTGLFGPSGCGKTSLLRCLAGLIRLDGGFLAVDGAVWQDKDRFLPPHRRAIGYVFQEARLFSHLSVRGNLHFGLRRAPAAPTLGLDAVIDMLGLEAMLDRAPAALSGGERQRVAIGRALLAQPSLFLMDEPLSALDRKSREDILPYLERLPGMLSVPMLYVSHDIAEIERLADHGILMGRDGRILASAPLSALLTDLALPPARASEAAVVLTVRVVAYDAAYDLTHGDVAGLPLVIPGCLGAQGTMRRVRLRAGDVSLCKQVPIDSSVLNILPVRLLSVAPGSANQMLLLLAVGDEGDVRLLSSITRKSLDLLQLRPGDRVYAQVKGMALVGAG